MSSGPDRDLEVRHAVAAALLLGVLPLVVPAAAHADDADCASVSASTTPPPSTDDASSSLSQMELPTPLANGAGVTVALVDSDGSYFHGTAAAGLISGPSRPDGKAVGVAPGASVDEIPVYGAAPGAQAQPTSAQVAQGLQSLIASPPPIVVVPLQVPDSPALKAAVEGLIGAGTVVVAAAGDRDTGQASPSPYTGSEDAAGSVFPAGYPGVVAVAAALDDPSQVDLANSRTTVAAPMTGTVVSYALGGGTCLVTPSSSFAAAEVGGVLALIKQRFPHASGTELVQRLTQTASGRPDVSDPFEGAGVVQPLEALTRPLGTTTAPHQTTRPATVPRAEPDLLRGTRRAAVWWGLGSGGLLVLALLLRPLLARRRPAQ